MEGQHLHHYVLDSDGGSACNALPFEYGQPLIGLPTSTRDGYTFDGWKDVPLTMPASDITLTALWKVNTYTITFDTDGGTSIPAITQAFGTPVTAPADPTKTGYTFVGWDIKIPATMPASNITLTAMWEANNTLYTVSYTSDVPNLTFADAQYKENEVIKHPTPYARGYKFTGWVQADGSPAPKKMPAQNLSLSARWEELPLWQASIEIVGVDGLTAYPELRLYEGEFINLPTFADVIIGGMPLLSSHTLLGWSVKDSSDPVPQTMPAGDITLVVRFGEFNSPTTAAHTVTYNTGCSSPASFDDKTVYAYAPLPAPRSRCARRLSVRRLVYGYDLCHPRASLHAGYGFAAPCPLDRPEQSFCGGGSNSAGHGLCVPGRRTDCHTHA